MCRFSKLLLFSFFFCKDGSDRLMKRASCSCCNFLCVVLAAAYLKYRRCRLSCLPFVWHFFSLWHTHTHTHARTHARTHAHTHTHTHTYTHTHTNAHVNRTFFGYMQRQRYITVQTSKQHNGQTQQTKNLLLIAVHVSVYNQAAVAYQFPSDHWSQATSSRVIVPGLMTTRENPVLWATLSAQDTWRSKDLRSADCALLTTRIQFTALRKVWLESGT